MMQSSSLTQQMEAPVVVAPSRRSDSVPVRCAELAAMPLSKLLYRVLIVEKSASV